jgi:hypothetical protein
MFSVETSGYAMVPLPPGVEDSLCFNLMAPTPGDDNVSACTLTPNVLVTVMYR